MAKFCGNCGSKMDDNAKVCGNCGTPMDGSVKTSNVRYVDPAKKAESRNKAKKMLKLGISVVAVILIVFTVFNTVMSFTGYNGFIRKVMKAYEEYNVNELINLSSEAYYYIGDENYADYYFEDAVGYALEAFESNVGYGYKFKYEIDDAYELSNRKTQNELDRLVANGVDVSSIEKFLIANITITVKKGDRVDDRAVSLTLTKERGDWKLLYIE